MKPRDAVLVRALGLGGCGIFRVPRVEPLEGVPAAGDRVATWKR